MTKQSSAKENLGIDVNLYKKWIEWQFKSEMSWSNKEVYHVKPISMFDVSVGEQLKKAFIWRNTQPLLTKDHQQKKLRLIS